MNTKQLHSEPKRRGSADVTYLGRTVDEMILRFMAEHDIPGLTLAIVQAPYIPRVVGYGLADEQQRRLASVNTMWPVGPISQAFAAVAVMQLHERGLLDLAAPAGTLIPGLPESWRPIPVLTLLRHASGLPDYRRAPGWRHDRAFRFDELVALAADAPLRFAPGTAAEPSATNFLLLTEMVARVSGQSYRRFVKENQIDFLGLRHTAFAEDLGGFFAENVAATGNVHQLFKADGRYIEPTEPAQSYGADGRPVPRADSSALPGFSDLWASAQDVSYWDIALAGSVLIKAAENRALLYAPWTLPNGETVPAAAGWQFYRHRGLMDIKGSVPGYSCFLSRFTHADELVCVTLLANREGVDFTNLGRRIAGAFGDLLSTEYDDNRLFLLESPFSAEKTLARLEDALREREIPVFARFDHAGNARRAGLSLRPTNVVVFGSPRVGTGLMQADQSIALDLPLRIAVWEDEHGSVWLGFQRLSVLGEAHGIGDSPVLAGMERLLEELARRAGSLC